MSLPKQAKAGIADARPMAERKLKAYLKQFNPDADVLDTVPGFKRFAVALFDGGAAACKSEGRFGNRQTAERVLKEDLIAEVIDQMSPARALAAAKGDYKRPHNFGIEYQPNQDPLAVDPDGNPLDANAQRYASLLFAPHGDIEFFLSEAHLRFKLFPHELKTIIDAIRAHLNARIFHWVGRVTAGTEAGCDMEIPNRTPNTQGDMAVVADAFVTSQISHYKPDVDLRFGEPIAEPEATQSETPNLVPPRRTPDLESSRQRLELVSALARELVTIKQELRQFCTTEGLKKKFPSFVLWNHIEDIELKELVAGEPFQPKAYAETLTLRKFGITSRETLKKDRRKLRRADRTSPR